MFLWVERAILLLMLLGVLYTKSWLLKLLGRIGEHWVLHLFLRVRIVFEPPRDSEVQNPSFELNRKYHPHAMLAR